MRRRLSIPIVFAALSLAVGDDNRQANAVRPAAEEALGVDDSESKFFGLFLARVPLRAQTGHLQGQAGFSPGQRRRVSQGIGTQGIGTVTLTG